MKTNNKAHKNMPDLTRIENGKSVGIQLEEIIKNANKLTCEEMKRKLMSILDDPKTHVSKEKAYMYKNAANKIYDDKRMRDLIVNIYLAAANMGLNL